MLQTALFRILSSFSLPLEGFLGCFFTPGFPNTTGAPSPRLVVITPAAW